MVDARVGEAKQRLKGQYTAIHVHRGEGRVGERGEEARGEEGSGRHTWRNERADSFGKLADVSTLQASGYQVIHQHLILRQIQEALAIQFLRLECINKDFGRDDGLGIPGDLVTTPVLQLFFFKNNRRANKT